MKIEKTSKVSGVGPLQRLSREDKAETGAPGTIRTVEDTTSVLGIPPEEMTPRVRKALMQLIEEVNRLRAELAGTKQRIGELASLADEDTLVPTANRRAFLRELTRIISYSERYGASRSLVYFDLNDLKTLNDRLGHAAGDAALQFFAKTLISNIRDSDIVGRIGGDEFGIILLNSDERTAAAKACELTEYLRCHPMEWQGESIYIDAAHGVVSFRPGLDAGTAMAEADRAMYDEKRRLKSAPDSHTES